MDDQYIYPRGSEGEPPSVVDAGATEMFVGNRAKIHRFRKLQKTSKRLAHR
jgi:hypothetical protein